MAKKRNPKQPAKKPPTDGKPDVKPDPPQTESSIHQPLMKPDSVVSFDISAPAKGDSERTLGASLSDFPELTAHLRPDGPKSGGDSSKMDIDLPAAGPTASSSHLFGVNIPTAEPASSDSGFANLQEFSPVAPASGWFDTQGDGVIPTAMPVDGATSDPISAPSSGVAGGSDIFSGGPIPTAQPKSDVSDVIMATAYVPPAPTVDKPSAKIHGPRPSDIALTFDAPPGGSTLQDAAAEADLPVADEADDGDEMGDSMDSLFGGDDEDSHLTRTPHLPDADAANLGDSPEATPDASSILADLSSEHGSHAGDSSAIRLEAPGVRPASQFSRDSTEDDIDLAEEAGTDWRSQSGSDLFADRTRSEFELLPDAGAVDPFLEDVELDQPSLSTAPSSIFSGGHVPSGGSTGSVPNAGNPDSIDAVEFSDHPDPNAADSGAFHISPTGSVEFDLPADSHPERSMRAPIPEDDEWMEARPSEAPASGVMFRRPKSVHPADDAPPVKSKPRSKAEILGTDPSMEVDWVSGDSVEQEAPSAIKSRPSEPRPREKSPAESPSKRGLVGAAIGLLVGVGISAGAYFSGIVPNKDEVKPVVPVANNGNTQPVPPPPAVDAHAALHGDPAAAMKALEAAGARTPQDKAALGQARLFARFRELAQTSAAMKPDDAEIAKARTELEGVMNDGEAAKSPEGEKAAVRAALHLGLTYEAAGDRTKAQEIYTAGIAKFPRSAEFFQTALDRLSATAVDSGKTSLRLTPIEVERLASAAAILLVLEPVAAVPAAAPEEPAEAGPSFWKAVNAAAAGKFDEALKQVAAAKKAHEKRAKFLAGRGLNPLSDPLEQIFPRCCDELTAYWQLRKTLYEHPGLGEAFKKGVGKALDQLAGAEKRALDQAKLAADLKNANETLAADLKTEKAKAAAIDKDLTGEKAKVVKLEADAKVAAKEAAKMVEDLKAAFMKSERISRTIIKEQESKLDDFRTEQVKWKKEAAERQKAMTELAKPLVGAKLLAEKHDDAALLAAVKSTVSRATGPDLTKLIPADLAGVAGTGLSAGHLLTLANRVNAAEANSRKAAEENKKLAAAHAADLKRIANDAEKLAAAHLADLKKAAEAAATAAEKQKAVYAAKMKEAAAEFALEAKKLAEANDARVKSLEAAIAVEKRRAETAEERFKAQFGDALSPSRQLDLWLAMLVELRRPTDADPALTAATKALKTAEPGSDDAAKAETVAGLALLLTNNSDAARTMFESAKRTPAYAAARGKGWAAALDLGSAAVLDPTAIVRETFKPGAKQKDVLAAARNLDAGITAYKAGRYADAERALAETIWHDANDPVAWYYLGATRWAQGKRDQARADYQQGSAREGLRLVPARQIDAAIRPIQGAARDALSAARP